MATIIKYTKKYSGKKHVKDIKIILKKTKTKGGKRSKTDIKISLKQKKNPSVSSGTK